MKTTVFCCLLLLPTLVKAQTTLLFTLGTGGDDLRGGKDNVNVIILLRSGISVRFANVNEGRRLTNSTLFSFRRTLPANGTSSDITSIQLETTFVSGMFGGDAWNLDRFQVTAEVNGNRTTLINQRGNPLFRFRIGNQLKLFPLAISPPPSPTADLMLDADFGRPEIPLGPFDVPTPPQYAEPLNHPGKPIPGTITGDLYSFRTGNSDAFVVAADPSSTAGPRFLRLPHLPVMSMMNLIGQRFSVATNTSRRLEARLVFVARDLMRDDVVFILNDPAAIVFDGISDGIPNGVLRLRLQDGQIWAKTDDPAAAAQQVGTFRVNVRTEITVKLLLRPNSVVEVSVSNGGQPTVDRRLRTPARTTLPIDQLGRLAWHVMPPVYQQRPTQPQEFRLLGAYIQSY